MSSIVLIEDDQPMRILMERVLVALDVELHTAADAKAGLDLVRSVNPDILLLDLHLRGASDLSGLDVIAAVRYDAPVANLPIVVISGDSRFSRAGVKKIGCDDFLLKPFGASDLRTVVERYL